MNNCFVLLATLGALCAAPAWASGGGNGSSSGTADRLSRSTSAHDADFVAGQAAIKQKNWREAVTQLEKMVQRTSSHADSLNLLGYAYRHLGEMEKSFANYERALSINPQHKDAHEYVGEAYLQVGNLAKAEEHLRALDKICWLPCEQHTELKEKIEDYKRKAAGGVGGSGATGGGHHWMRAG